MNLKRYLFALLFLIGLLPMAMAQQTAADSTIIYKVKQGENLYRLSLKFNCSVQQIKDWNKLNNEDY
jgi:LysM repeat protein